MCMISFLYLISTGNRTMKFKKCTHTRPDDGQISIDGTVIVENTSKNDVELVYLTYQVLNSDGVVVDGSYSEEEVFIKPGSSTELSVWSWVDVLPLGGLDDIKIQVSANLFKREFQKVGTVDFPKNNTSEVIKKKVPIGGSGEMLGVVVARKDNVDEDDGTVSLDTNITAGFKNLTDKSIRRVQFTARAYDQRDVEMAESDAYESVEPNSYTTLKTSFWDLNKDQVDNAEIRITASVFSEVATSSAESKIKLEK